MMTNGERFLWAGVGVAIAAVGGAALGYERVPKEPGVATPTETTVAGGTDSDSTNPNGTTNPNNPQLTTGEQIPIPAVEIPTTVGSAAVAETIVLPRTSLTCDGPVVTDLSVDNRAYFVSSNQYSILVALDSRFNPTGNEAISDVIRDVPPEFAHDLSSDLAEYNDIPLGDFNPDNFPPGTYKTPTSCDAPGRPNYIP